MDNKDLERAIYKWFNMTFKLYNKLEHDGSIYLYNYEGEEYADIRILTKSKQIYFNWYFWEDFFEIFPIKLDEFKQVMSKWVGDTFNLNVSTSDITSWAPGIWLEIPK